MKRTIDFVLTAVTLAVSAFASGSALAATSIVPAKITGANPSLTFEFSELLVGALYIANFRVVALGTTRVIEDEWLGSITADALVKSPHVLYDDELHAVATHSYKSNFGILLNAPQPNVPAGKRGSAYQYGWLTLNNLEVDFSARAVYADVAGDHGLVSKQRQHMWSFGSVASSTVPGTPGSNSVLLMDDIRELVITEEGFDLFAQGLGLTNFGKSSMAGITSYGSIRSQMTVAVPEPATYAMMGIGLAGLAWAGRARRSRPPSTTLE